MMITDRELDLLVVEKVMEMKPARIWKLGTSDGSPPEFVIPPYSTDISAAWEVIHNWTLKDNCWEIGKTEPDGRLVYCKLTTWDRIDNTYKYFIAKAPSVPRAICLAALKAVGHEI